MIRNVLPLSGRSRITILSDQKSSIRNLTCPHLGTPSIQRPYNTGYCNDFGPIQQNRPRYGRDCNPTRHLREEDKIRGH